MKVEVLEQRPTKVKLLFTETNPSFVNALRRALIAEVPKMAIDSVEFHLGPIMDESGAEYESVSPLFDEIVSHRLGMLPVPTEPGLYNFRASCSCGGEGCPSCTILYSLNKKGPGVVYSGDLDPLGDAKLKIREERVPIVELGEREAILAYATAELGVGRSHAKWQAAHGAGYRYLAKITVDQAKIDLPETYVKLCPKDVFAAEGRKLLVKHEERCNLCNACVEESKGAIQVEGDPSRLLFQFETDGALTAKQALLEATKILGQRFEQFKEFVSDLEK